MINIRKIDIVNDFYLIENYLKSKNNISSIRLHDLVYRISSMEEDDGRTISKNNIYVIEESNLVVGSIIPDGENIYLNIDDRYESSFKDILSFIEKNLNIMFRPYEDGSYKLWIAVDSNSDKLASFLNNDLYKKYDVEENYNIIYPNEFNVTLSLTPDYKLLYGNEFEDEIKKWSAMRIGFHPELEEQDFSFSITPYNKRKESNLYKDSFECLIVNDQDDICSICFVYVDSSISSALIEPVCTRQKYQNLGLGKNLIYGVILKLKEIGIEKCYVDSFGSSSDFYKKLGFNIERKYSFYSKMINN